MVQKIALPKTITKVPALLLPNRGFQVLFGQQILQHLQPKQLEMQNKATNNDMEPMAFGFSSNSSSISSDHYSFLDMSSDDLGAKGDGGMRQMYNYVGVSDNMPIETPPDTYIADKVNESELEKYQQQRNNLKT